jgi:hypothetical protein
MCPRESEIDVTGWGDTNVLSYPDDESSPSALVDIFLENDVEPFVDAEAFVDTDVTPAVDSFRDMERSVCRRAALGGFGRPACRAR